MILRAFVLNADEQNAISTQHSSNRGHVFCCFTAPGLSVGEVFWLLGTFLVSWSVCAVQHYHGTVLNQHNVLHSWYGAVSWLFL